MSLIKHNRVCQIAFESNELKNEFFHVRSIKRFDNLESNLISFTQSGLSKLVWWF